MLESLAPFALLACPLGMGAMMWMMMRGKEKEEAPRPDTTAKEAELASLRAEIDQMQAQQRDQQRQTGAEDRAPR